MPTPTAVGEDAPGGAPGTGAPVALMGRPPATSPEPPTRWTEMTGVGGRGLKRPEARGQGPFQLGRGGSLKPCSLRWNMLETRNLERTHSPNLAPPDQTKSSLIKPNQTKSNQIQLNSKILNAVERVIQNS